SEFENEIRLKPECYAVPVRPLGRCEILDRVDRRNQPSQHSGVFRKRPALVVEVARQFEWMHHTLRLGKVYGPGRSFNVNQNQWPCRENRSSPKFERTSSTRSR